MTDGPYCTDNAGVLIVDRSAGTEEQIAMVLDDFDGRMTVGGATAGTARQLGPDGHCESQVQQVRCARCDLCRTAAVANDALAPALNCSQPQAQHAHARLTCNIHGSAISDRDFGR
ncbi:MAG TPA: hypothetical protein VF516_46955 [Kofleriaceae bacterium]